MEPMDYIVERIDGDYAYLKRIDAPSDDLVFVARALLPEAIDEGTKLHFENLAYEIIL